MAKISEVQVSYRRSVQPRQYESAESSVKLVLLFAEDEAPDVDAVISQELDRVKGLVNATLGIEQEKPAPAPANAAPKEKPAPAPANAAPKEKPAAAKEAPAPELTHADAVKAISAAIERLNKQGKADGSAQVKAIVASFLPKDVKRVTYTEIEQGRIAEFVSEIEKLGR